MAERAMRARCREEDYAELRGILLRRAEEVDPDGSAAVALSGGIDSLGVLFAELELGRRPTCYTFHMDGYESEDLRASRNVCGRLGLRHVVVTLPTDVDSMYRDVRRVVPHLAVVKKTTVECTIPWLYLLPAIEEGTVLLGLGGDDLFCNDRRSQVMLRKVGEEGMVAHRLHKFDDVDNADRCIIDLGRERGKRIVDFYDSPEIIGWAMRFCLRALNRPFQKAPLVLCWRDWYGRGNFYKRHSDYQVNSRLRDYYARLLQSEYNVGGHRSVVGIYNDVARELRASRDGVGNNGA